MTSNRLWFRLGTLVCLASVLCFGAMAQTEQVDESDTMAPGPIMLDAVAASPTFVVTYFHGDQRCATCLKLEAYAKEAIETAFAQELADSTLVWRTVNYDSEGNQHYIEDYGLYSKALIVSQLDGGDEKAWNNLDKIWEKVGDKEEYIKYVQDETRQFMAGDADDE